MSKLEKSWTTSLYVASPNSVHRLLTGRDTLACSDLRDETLTGRSLLDSLQDNMN